jgi:flagellar M-ring protein FliF
MDKILGYFKSMGEKWKGLSNVKKIAIFLLFTGLIFGIILSAAYVNKSSYEVLYSNVDPQYASKILDKLKSENIKYKVEGDSILVPKVKAAELRMSVAMDMSSLNKGFEIFDQSTFGVTDSEAKVMYQRALEGELARTIQSLDEVEKARVHLVMPEESVFVKDTEKATASVIIKPKGLHTLNPEQVKAIIALVSGAVKNLPRENVQVLDTYANLLSENILDDTTQEGTVSALKQQDYEKQFEEKLQNDVKTMLESVFGKDKVDVKVNADLDFDSKKITTISYDKDKIERSRQLIKENANDSAGSGSAVGNSANQPGYPAAGDTANQNSNSSSEQETVNYEIGQTEESVVKAPGEVKNLSVSVLIDGSLNDLEKTEIRNIVSAAVNYDEKRGDNINIAALPFNTELEDKAAEAVKEMDAQAKKEKLNKLITNIVSGVAAAAFLIALLVIFGRRRKEPSKELKPSLDVIIGDVNEGVIIPKQPVAYDPILDADEDDAMNLQKELQNYASKKPDQVVEVIKTWLTDDFII